MPHESIDRDRTAGSLSHGVFAASLLLVTAYPQPKAVLDEAEVPKPPTRSSSETAASGRTDSALRYREMTAVRLACAAIIDETAAWSDLPRDPRADIREQIRSATMEQHNEPDVTPPSAEAIADALRFVDLLPHGAPLPHMSVAEDGEINFFRRQPGLFVDIGFFGDGEIHYYARVDSAGVDIDGSEPFGGRALPRALIVALTAA